MNRITLPLASALVLCSALGIAGEKKSAPKPKPEAKAAPSAVEPEKTEAAAPAEVAEKGATEKSEPSSSTGKSAKTSTTAAALGEVDADKVEKDESAKHLTGIEVTLRPSFGGAAAGSPVRYQASPTAALASDPGQLLDGTGTPYGSGFVGQAMLGVRFHPVISAGLRGGYRSASAGNLPDGSAGVARTSWDAGLYVRGYPLALTPSIRKHVDPWVGVGVGYMRDTQSFNRGVATTAGSKVVDWSLDHHAVAVPLSLGVDYRVLPAVSVGPSFEYTLANAVAGCARIGQNTPGVVGSSYCSNEGVGQKFIKAEGYGVWTAGLDVRATVF